MFTRNKLAVGISLALAASVPAVAQDAQDEQMLEEVVVTGSRIVRSNVNAPTPITTVDSQTIEFTGQLNSADILRTLPATGVSGLTSENSNFFTSGGGINTIELRNLGEDRTLVLVNGRRYVSGLAGSNAVDWNTIPTELIDRVEVITGGASAIYGSDALAGVVNVILKDDFEGVEFNVQYGEHWDAGDDERLRMNFTAGGNFDDGKGNAVISATYSDQGGVWARDRANTATDDIALCRFTGDINDCKTSEVLYSSFSEFGRFFVPSTGASFVVDNGVGPNGDVVPWVGGPEPGYGFNRQAFRRYSVPTERYLMSSNVTWDINDSIETFVETMVARTETSTDIEPFPHSNSDINIGGISVDNPFVPQDLRDIILAAGDTEIQYFRRTTELITRGSDAERTTWRAVFGLRGDLDDQYNWDVFFGQGQMQDSQRSTGQLNAANFREALNAEIGPDGSIRCANAFARNEGCVPINLFGFGSISPDAADYVRALKIRDQSTKQTIGGANLTGDFADMLELPGGPLAFAIGYEYRKEEASDIPDPLTQSGQNAGNAEAPTFGEFESNEVYVELEAPLLSGVALAKELTVGVAYRYSDYDTIGSTDSYTARVLWQPTDSVRIRGQYARSQRAPNIAELFSPGGENFAPVSDPCNGVTATTSGRVAENCRQDPTVAARIAEVGVFDLTQTEIQGTGGFTGRGNGNLEEETADSYTLGVVFDHDFGAPGAMTLSVDWYRIEIDALIDTVGRQTSVDFCYDSDDYPNNAFCQLVVRDTTGPAFQLGEITEVNSGFVNEGKLETEGVDVQVQWNASLNDWSDGLSGSLMATLNYGYVDTFTATKFGTVDPLVGELGYAENEWLLNLTYAVGPFTVNWETQYIDDVVPDKSNDLFNFSVGDYMQHDLYMSYEVTGGTVLYLGINDVFDKDEPIVLSGIPGNTTGTDTSAAIYNPIGRTAFAGVRARF